MFFVIIQNDYNLKSIIHHQEEKKWSEKDTFCQLTPLNIEPNFNDVAF